MRKPYPTDLTDQQWELFRPLVPPAKHGGRPREVDLREVLNTLFYLNRSGCQWDMLPHDLLPKGFHVRRDKLPSIAYSEELISFAMSTSLQSTDRHHGIVGQKRCYFQLDS